MSDPVVPAASPLPATGGAGPAVPVARDGTATVPDVSADLYRAVVEFAASAPSAVHVFAVIFTEAGVVALGLLMLLRWWRARAEDDRWASRAVLAPVVTVLAYLVSETAKSVLRQDRPCHAMPDVTALAGCPPAGDWSFPSNHATIAGAAAVAVLLSHAVREGPRDTGGAAA
ncbi:phosphatase PAP2 family protein, partial [Saccharomonospora iraqiensis]|uniref:phosphatase PAP2 family protein n=1 Tax=Saccharomonospora iraqiensis TaxID=52698 RepID=UPI00022E1605